ncbi:hypothetical protein [Peribacillus simplex]|nr:hypothetical protein [Peribacillus simplex]
MMLQKKMAQQVKTKSTTWGYVAYISALLYAAPHAKRIFKWGC